MDLQISQAFSKYIGIPYEKADCWELVRRVYLEVFDTELLRYYEGTTPESAKAAALIRSNKGDFVLIEGEPRLGDLMLIRLLGVECHIGMFVGRGKFLHTTKGTGSILDSVGRYNHRIVGYYRHRDKA